MTTHLSQTDMDAYIDGTLTVEESGIHDAHLEQCNACRQEVHKLRSFQRALSQHFTTQLDQEHPSSRMRFATIGRQLRQPPAPRRKTALYVAAAVALFIGGGATLGLVQHIAQNNTQQTPEHASANTPLSPAGSTTLKLPPLDKEPLGELPTGWLSNVSEGNYAIGTTNDQGRDGDVCSVIISKEIHTSAFGAIRQTIDAKDYLGKRLRMRGHLSSLNAKGRAGLWMRVDNAQGKPIAFDNMQDRPIRDTTPWQSYSIVLDIPKEANSIVFGALLSGEGVLGFDDVSFDTVDLSVPTTDKTTGLPLAQPTNLDFEGTQP